MAEVIENTSSKIPMGKINGALTTGIIGTSLSGLMALGLGTSFLGNKNNNPSNDSATYGSLYNERKEQADYVELTKQYYVGQLNTQNELSRSFFDLYKMNVDSSWGLYKNHIDDSFQLYKNQRDQKDDLLNKINDLEKKVDVMAAVRPYQDALINAKIDNVALVGDFNLARRTCRMLQGELVLPSTPTVTGYPSYTPCINNSSSSTTTGS